MHVSEFPFPAGIKVYLLSEDNTTRKVLVLLLLPGHGIKFKDTDNFVKQYGEAASFLFFFPS